MELENMLFSAGYDLETFRTISEHTLRYTPDVLVDLFAGTSVPILMMNGTLDPQTPLRTADPLGAHFDSPTQHYVVVDRAAHGILSQSRYETDPSQTCGWDLLEAFLREPSAPLNTACRTQTEEIDFSGEPWLAETFFGTENSLFGARYG